MLVFQKVFKVGIGSFLLCISKSGVLCVLCSNSVDRPLTFWCACITCFFLSPLNHAVEISDNIKHIKICNATC